MVRSVSAFETNRSFPIREHGYGGIHKGEDKRGDENSAHTIHQQAAQVIQARWLTG
jgi:hypothetical protein